MFIIEGNKMKIIKGDTALFNFALDEYKLKEGDKVFFTVRKGYKDNIEIQKIVTNFNDGIATFLLEVEDTDLEPGSYLYDIQVTLLDGRVDTVAPPSRFIVLGGITND